MNPFHVILGLAAAGVLITSGLAARSGFRLSNRDLGPYKSRGAALALPVSTAESRLTKEWGAIVASEVELERKSLKSSEKWTDFSKRLSDTPKLKITQPISTASEARAAMVKANAILSESQDVTNRMLDGIVAELQTEFEVLATDLAKVREHAKIKPSVRIAELFILGENKTQNGLKLLWVSNGRSNQGFWTTPSEITRTDWNAVFPGQPVRQDKPAGARKPEFGDYAAAARRAAYAGLNPNNLKTLESIPGAIEKRVADAQTSLHKRAVEEWQGQQKGNNFEEFPEALVNIPDKVSCDSLISGLQKGLPILKDGWSFRLPREQEWKVLTSDKAPKGLDDPRLSEWLFDSDKPIGPNWNNPNNPSPPAAPGTVGFRIVLAGPPTS